jgi:hypothetical protein
MCSASSRLAASRRLACLGLALSSGAALAQDSGYEKLAALPDWSGTWLVNYSGPNTGFVTAPELTEAGMQQVEAYRRMAAAGELPESGAGTECVPNGMPGVMSLPLFLVEFYFTPSKIVAYTEAYGMVRWIYTDGRSVPEFAIPSYMGYSIGHWQGDTLVVSTTNLYEGSQLSIPDPGGRGMVPVQHSDEMRLEERIHLIDEDTLEIQTTISDPVIFAEPGKTRYTFERHTGEEWEVSEFVCAQNNRAYLDEEGRLHQRLTTD